MGSTPQHILSNLLPRYRKGQASGASVLVVLYTRLLRSRSVLEVLFAAWINRGLYDSAQSDH